MNRVVTLIGYRATGKSSVGPALADRLGWTCIDSDVLVEEKAGRSIAKIFADDDGEAEFRRLERSVIADLLTGRDLVLSAGGGANLNKDTRVEAKQAGPVVWLQASVDAILARLTSDPKSADTRPSLTDHKDQRAEIVEVLKQRTKVYADAATIVVDTDSMDIETVIDTVHQKVAAALAHGDDS